MATKDYFEKLTVSNVYTFDEAIEYMKARDKHVTTNTITWVSIETGKEVCIGFINHKH